MTCGGTKLKSFPAIGDHQTALLGAGVEVGDLSLNISTGSQVSQITPTLMLGPYQTHCYFHGGHVNTITHLPAGRSLNVLIDFLTELSRAAGVKIDQPWKHVNELVSRVDEATLSARLSFFSGPMGDVGSIENITVDNLTVGQLFQASFRNMAENYRHCADLVCPQGHWPRIVLSGGLTQSAPQLRRQIQKLFPQANSFESAEQEETLMGLLKVARQLM
jgi:sugar (pentulose or hexulose) kinase